MPYGVSEESDVQVLRMYCPYCREVYISARDACSTIEGAYFGHSYLFLFLQKYPELVQQPIKTKIRLFGFRIELDDGSESESEEEE